MVEITSIKNDFSFLFKNENILAILLYGSVLRGEESPRSDIDICIVAPFSKKKKDLINKINRNLDVFSKKYDIRLFEELPLYIQAQIIQAHQIIYVKDIYELFEYFYYFRKIWEEQAPRNKVTDEELSHILE